MIQVGKLETFSDAFACFVRLTTDSEASGWGRTSTYNADITATISHRLVAPWALGADVLDIDVTGEQDWDLATWARMLGAIPNADKYLEFSIQGSDYYPWQEGLFLGDPFAIRDGASRSIPNGW